jgi:hypothetical protein
VTYKPGIDEGKLDCFTLYLSFYAFQRAGTHDACLQIRRVCDIYEKRDVNCRGEVWIGKAFHLANLPTIAGTSRLQNHRLLGNLSPGFMQPFSFLLLIASLACALPAKSAEQKLLTPDNFSKTIAKGYW